MELPIHCDSPTELTEEVVFEYWGKSAHDSITCPCFTNETISVPGLLESEYSDCFEKLGCMEINSSSAFFLHNRLGCRIVLEIIKDISSRPDQIIQTSMLYNQIKAHYLDTFLIISELNDQICHPLIDILLTRMVDMDYLKRNMNSDDLRTFYTVTEKGIRVDVNKVYPARNLEELVRNIAHKYLTRRTKRAATSVTYPKSSSSSSVNVSVNVTSSRILPIGNLLHTSIISSHPGDVNIESSSRDIHDLSPAALATVEEIGRISYEWPKLESQTEPQANEKLFNSGCRDQQQIEDVLDSKGDSSKKNLFEDNIVWDDSSQSTSDDLREEVEVEVGNESEYLTESISDQLGDKKDEKPAEFAFEITAEKKDCLLKTSKFNFGVLCQRNENKLVDHVKLKVKRKSEEKLVPLTEKRAPRACIGKNFRYIDRFASNYIEDIDENGSSRCSKKGSSSKSQASLQCLESSKKATNGSEKLQYSLNNEQLLDKFLDKLTKGTDYPRKYPKVDGASQAVILQELLIMSKAEPPNILWQPKIEELQHVLHQAFSCHKCRASLFHPGSVIQAYVGNEVIFVCVLGCYSPTSPDHIAGNPAALDQKLEKENMLVVFDGEINHAINADFCLLPYSDDDIIAVLREQRPSPSSDCLLSANDIAFIVGSTIFKTIKSQWRLIEVEEYFQSRSFYDDKYGVLRESFKTKTKSRLEVIRLHQYFLPLTATIKNGDHCWGERRMLQLFQRAELVLSSNSSIYKIDDHGNMTTSWQTPLKISTNTNSCKTSAELKNYEWIVDLTGDNDDYPIPLGSMPSSSITSPPMMCGYELLCIQEVKCNNSDDRFVKVFHNSHKQKCLELIDRDESEEDDGDDYDDDDNNNDDDGDGDGDDDGDGDGDDDNDNIKDGDEPEEMEEEFINTSPELKVAVEVFQVPTIKQTPYFERNSKLFKPCPYKESHQYESLEQINPFTGKIVHRYATKWIAAQSMQMPSPFPIIRCCLGIQKICHNFKWSFSKIKEFPGWNDGLSSMESLLIEKNTRSYPSRKLFRKKKDGSSNIHMEEESVKGNMRNGVNRLHIGLETGEAVSPPLGIDDVLPLTEFMDGERDSCGEENASIAPCKDTLPSILSREECVVSTALNHPVLDVLKDSILPPPEVNQIGSHTNIQNTYSLVICTPHQQSPIIDKVILIDDAVDIAEPPAVHSSPLPPVLFGDIEPLTGLTYIQIIMIAISRLDQIYRFRAESCDAQSSLSSIAPSTSSPSTSTSSFSSSFSSSSSSSSIPASLRSHVTFTTAEIIIGIFTLFPEINQSILRNGKIDDFKVVLQRALSDGLQMKNIQHGKRLKHDQETFRLRIAGKKKIGLLSRVMSACLDVRTPHREKQSDARRNSSNSVPNLELQTNEQVVELQCIVSPLPFVSFSDVAATKINNIDMKETSLREDLTGPLYSDTYDQGVVSSVRSDIQNCVPHVYQVKEGKSDIDRTSEGISENYRVEQEKDGIDSNGVNSNLNIEKEKATIQEKVISVEMCRKRDRELGRMKNEDEMKELYSCLKKSRAILWQSSESTETICPNSNPIQEKHDFQNNLPTGNMAMELSTVIMNSDSGLENVIVKN